MRILGNLVMMIFLAAGLASASTIDLNDGRSVQGNIVSQDNKSLQINVDGVTMTYYADEIKDVDGKPFAAGPAQPADTAAAPVPVAQPEAVAPAPVAQPEAAVQPEVAPVSAPVSNPAEGVISPEKRALILKFMDVFGTHQALTNNFDLMVKQIAKDKPEEAQTISQRVKVDEIIDRLIPIYDRNFSTEDLQAFIAFYGSDEGQKLIHTIPELMKESVTESIKYMKEKFPESNQGAQ